MNTNSPNESKGGTAAAIEPMRLLRVYWPVIGGAAVLSVILGIALYMVLLRVAPVYTSRAIFQVQAPSVGTQVQLDRGVGQGGEGEEFEIFIATEVQRATSDDLLQRVLNEPLLRQTTWINQFIVQGTLDESEALEELRDVVNSSSMGQTANFVISVDLPSPTDATTVATAARDVYIKDYRDRHNQGVREFVREIEGLIRTLNDQINELDTQMTSILDDNDIQSVNNFLDSWQDELRSLNPTIVGTRESISLLQDQLTEYQTIDNREGPPVYPDSIREEAKNTPVVLRLSSEIAIQQGTTNALIEQFGRNHPDAVRAAGVLRGLQQEHARQLQTQMADTFAALIDNLTVQLSSLNATVIDLEARRDFVTQQIENQTAAVQRYQRLNAERELRNQTRLDHERTLAEYRLLENRAGRVRVLSNPSSPDVVSSPTPIPVLGGTVVLLTGLAIGIIVLKELAEKRVRTPRDVAAIPGTRVLGVIPERSLDPSKPESVAAAARGTGYGGIAEAAREIRNEIFKACRARGHQTILFVAGSPGAGSTSIVANLGHTAASVGKRTLLIDANLRKPELAQTLGVQGGGGLASLLDGEPIDKQAVLNASVPVSDNLWCLPAGANPTEALNQLTGGGGENLLKSAKEAFDLVLIDTPPATIAVDALSYAAHVDAAVLVCRAYNEKRGLVQRLRNQLADSRADFLGVIVNAVRASAGGYYKENLKAAAAYQNQTDAPPSQAVGSLAS